MCSVGTGVARDVEAPNGVPMSLLGSSLSNANLGDVVSVGDGRSLTVRARAALPESVGSMAGFVVCGECEALLSLPPSPRAPVGLYAPLNYIPAKLSSARPVFSGAVSYWAPHLPADGGAMGELRFRVAEPPGSVDPLVVVWRGNEPVVFCHYGDADPRELELLEMGRPAPEVALAERRTGFVTAPHTAPTPAPAPAVPAPSPVRARRRLASLVGR
jgi:hypothetical protein